MSEFVNAKIENYIYEANDSPYKIVSALLDDGTKITLVGTFPFLTLNLKYKFEGDYVNHPKFGRQFKVKSYTRLDIDSKEGIVAYLSSDRFKGIGEATASKIYDEFGSDCINQILNDKNILKRIKGFSDNKINSFYESLKSNVDIEATYIELYSYGLTPRMVGKLYDKYGDEVLNKIKENPYRLIYELEGFGFFKCDQLAMMLGFSYDDKIRIEEAVLYTLNNVCNSNGFTFLTDIQLENSAYQLLNKDKIDHIISKETIKKAIDTLSACERIIEEENRYYVKYLYDNEVNLAKKIIEINNKSDNTKIYPLSQLNDYLVDIELNNNIKYTESQKEAIFTSINSNISVITGGPGTGKTTIIRGILFLMASLMHLSFNDKDFLKKVLLCAPTGRAAKRLAESCNIKATTIHKALGYDYTGEFTYNEKNKLPYSIIIIDESSMIDLSLACNLFSAINSNAKVIMVGDENQLPSVGPGDVLHDIIESDLIHVSKLTEIMRQSLDSDIVKLSNDIKNNYINYDIFKNKKELFFYPVSGSNVVDKILLFIENFLSKGGSLQQNLQVLAPMYSGVCGIDAINTAIQNKFNTSDNMIVRGNKIFKQNDKVLQLQNDPILGIMNGDIGYIKDIHKDEEADYLYIDFDGVIVKYPASNFDNLTLAYAISIHKSQGSEYENVIMPVVPSYFVMLKRKLLYTAITRAKKKLIIIGDFPSLVNGINKPDEIRQTTLCNRLLNKLKLNSRVIYINDPDIPFDTLGEEGMENITPYTFMTESK
ncbi:MAG: ATP-dependent RecD-like DNA helicase [Anaeroplasmataceae bacterium]